MLAKFTKYGGGDQRRGKKVVVEEHKILRRERKGVRWSRSGFLQLKPSKWPLRIRSPIGEGALRGFLPSLQMVAERAGLRWNGMLS